MEQSKNKLRERLAKNAEQVEQELKSLCSAQDENFQNLLDAEAYSLLDGGKRIRPFLVREFCRMLGGDDRAAMPFACALEMIHTYSLIHDDLPCMDDDDLRHGKPSNHKVYGYATALLAGDALLTRSFGVAVSNPYVSDVAKCEAVRLLSDFAGEFGMIGGQAMDLNGEAQRPEFEELLRLHRLKCGALIECAALLGCLAAGYAPTDKEARAASVYAQKIGLTFQIIDDILDQYGDEKELGKNVGTDASHNKTTFLSFLNREEALAYAEELTAEAVSALSELKDSETLTDLAVYLLERTY